MNTLYVFLQMLHTLQLHTAGCYNAVERTGTVRVTYGGNCVQAFLNTVHVPDLGLYFN